MLNLNWVDYLILAILLFYSYEGYSSGFIGAVLDLANFIISFLVGLRAYGFFAGILATQLSIPKGFADAIGFFAITFIAEIILGILIKTFFTFELRIFKRLNNILGIVPGILSGLIIITFILVIAISLPVSKPIKSSISSSRLGGILLANTQGLEKNLKKVFGGAITETINFLTVEPKSSEIVSLNFKTSNFSLDPTAEQYMFE
ncbi:MAG: CvpA family protein, partial [Candidatus Levybacteria bacterium]|nr:CvpA family protein [Candidatus Levybacteria bacterium]